MEIQKKKEELAKKVLRLAECNVPLTTSLLTRVGGEIAVKMGVKTDGFVFSKKWFDGFFKRNKKISSRKGCKINRARSANFNRVAMEQWAAAVGPLIKLYKPEEIWNVDDTSKDTEIFSGMVNRSRACSVPFLAPLRV